MGFFNFMKIRRVGNSNVVTIPRELEQHGYVPGQSVAFQALPDGELLVTPAPPMQELMRTAGRKMIQRHQKALQILADHDSDPTAPTSREVGR